MKYSLSSLCEYRKGKVNVDGLNKDTYISTENMLPNKGGVIQATSLPTTSQTQEYKKGDVLVSNIRPYFKKIWQTNMMVDVQTMCLFLRQTKIQIKTFCIMF